MSSKTVRPTTLIILFLLIPLAGATSYTVSQPGFGLYYNGYNAHYHQTRWNLPSGVYNPHRYNAPARHNPFYLRSSNGGTYHMGIDQQLDNQYRKRPELFKPRVSIGPRGY